MCGTPRPTVIALAEKAFPVAPTAAVKEPSASAKRPKPASVLVAPNADPELDAYLAEWETASSKIRRLDCDFQKFVYNPTFEVERRGKGTIALERDQRARYRVVPVVIKPGEVSAKKSHDGNEYKLEPCFAECWHWTGREVFKIDEQHQIYETIPLPPIKGFDPSSHHELHEVPYAKPFFLGMPAQQLKGQFKIRIAKESNDELWLDFVPRRPEVFSNIERAVLILNRRSWLPRALKLYDPTGGQTVHIFQNIRVNQEAGDDLSKPNLEGYRRVVDANETIKTESAK
jgi:hypothetical protein